jgi:hypothetical protein
MPWYKEKTPLIAGLQLVAFFPYTIGVCARERVSAVKLGEKRTSLIASLQLVMFFSYTIGVCARE